MLFILLWLRRGPSPPGLGVLRQGEFRPWWPALLLFAYAVGFSFAYGYLDTGTGALILFAAVQLTMIGLSVFRGEKMHVVELLGVAIAFGGFVNLVLPSVSTPSFFGFVMMCLAGIAWGGYTLLGRDSVNPLLDTYINFLRTAPMFIVLMMVMYVAGAINLDIYGTLLAITSGALASGAGYAVWYAALRYLSATQAAVLQLSVPLIAAGGGVAFAGEKISLDLFISSLLILGGIFVVIVVSRFFTQPAASVKES